MADQAFAAGTFYGSTIALTTSTTLLGNVKALKWSGVSRKEVNTTHLLTTSGIETFLAGDIISPGTLDIDAQYDTNLVMHTLFIAAKCDTLTLTFPKRSVSCGAALPTTAAKIVFQVVILSAEPEYSNEDLMMMKFKFQVNGTPVFTAAVV